MRRFISHHNSRIKWGHPTYKSGNFLRKADSDYGLVEIKMEAGLEI
jgi:hypothetical protein